MNTTSLVLLAAVFVNLVTIVWSWKTNRTLIKEVARLKTIIDYKAHEINHALVSARSSEAAFKNEFDLHTETKNKLIDLQSSTEDQSVQIKLLNIDLNIDLNQVTSERDSARKAVNELTEELNITRENNKQIYSKLLEYKNSPANQVMEMSDLEFQVWTENPDKKMEFILATNEKSAIFPMKDQTWFDKNQKYSVFRYKDGFTKTYYTTAKRFWSEK
jgi:hypothetical protein